MSVEFSCWYHAAEKGKTVEPRKNRYGRGYYLSNRSQFEVESLPNKTGYLGKAVVSLEHPVYLDAADQRSSYRVMLDPAEVKQVLRRHPAMYHQPNDQELSPIASYLERYFDAETWSKEELEEMMDEVADRFFDTPTLWHVEAFFGDAYSNELHEALRDICLIDGLVIQGADIPVYDREAEILNDVLDATKMDDITFDYDDNGLVARDGECVWHGKEFYEFLLFDALVVEENGSIIGMRPSLVEELRALAKHNGVESGTAEIPMECGDTNVTVVAFFPEQITCMESVPVSHGIYDEPTKVGIKAMPNTFFVDWATANAGADRWAKMTFGSHASGKLGCNADYDSESVFLFLSGLKPEDEGALKMALAVAALKGGTDCIEDCPIGDAGVIVSEDSTRALASEIFDRYEWDDVTRILPFSDGLMVLRDELA